MNREEYILSLIDNQYENKKEFAKAIDMPYTTFLNVMKKGIGGTSIENGLKICKGLGITVDSLENLDNTDSEFEISEFEKELVSAYRNSDYKDAVNRLLCLDIKKENI